MLHDFLFALIGLSANLFILAFVAYALLRTEVKQSSAEMVRGALSYLG